MALKIAYYCSGHGYGHATRVSAFAGHLLALGVSVWIVSSAPAHIFSDSILHGAHYRYAEIDPIIVQPLAYQIDRPRSFQVLQRFLAQKDELAAQERDWMVDTAINCVITDAACLASLAAHLAKIPSILCTNFSFDSIFSYLSTHFVDLSSSSDSISVEEASKDIPLPSEELDPLVDQLLDAYRHADLLLLLPGAIPIPSFMKSLHLPSPMWLDEQQHFLPSVTNELQRVQSRSRVLSPTSNARDIVPTPLLVRDPSPDVYTRESRERLLSSIGVPENMHDHKILVVSFGGQKIVPPRSVGGSSSGSRASTPDPRQDSAVTGKHLWPPAGTLQSDTGTRSLSQRIYDTPHHRHAHAPIPRTSNHGRMNSAQELIDAVEKLKSITISEIPPTPRAPRQLRIATPSHIYVPGAPGAAPVSPPASADSPRKFPFSDRGSIDEETEPQLLPDDSWIAVVCGAGDTWDSSDLPERFFVAPKNVWMPDLTAISDVLMGKLGYSTCAECVDSSTPFIFVPRPLFLEEAGLRILIHAHGLGLEMKREQYESGDWAPLIQQAWERGKDEKTAKAKRGVDTQRQSDLRALAAEVVAWIKCRRGEH